MYFSLISCWFHIHSSIADCVFSHSHLGSNSALYVGSRVDSVDYPVINRQFLDSTILHIFIFPTKTNCGISSRTYFFFPNVNSLVTSPHSLLAVLGYHLSPCNSNLFIISFYLFFYSWGCEQTMWPKHNWQEEKWPKHQYKSPTSNALWIRMYIRYYQPFSS